MKVQILRDALRGAARRRTFLTEASHCLENLKLMLECGYITQEEYKRLEHDYVEGHRDEDDSSD